MSTFALIPGAGGAAWYWHRVVPLLEEAGHKAIAVDLPADDDSAGLEDYADCVVEVIGKRTVVVVAQSLGGFIAPPVCKRAYFFHDVTARLAKEAESYEREQSDRVMEEPCPFEAWPSVPTHVIAGRDDRLFPFEFQRRVARERLAVDVQGIRGGHLVALSNPQGLAKLLLKAA